MTDDEGPEPTVTARHAGAQGIESEAGPLPSDEEAAVAAAIGELDQDVEQPTSDDRDATGDDGRG